MNLNINLEKINKMKENNVSIRESMKNLILKTKTLVRDSNLYLEYMNNNQDDKLPVIDSTRSTHSKQRSCMESILPKINLSSLSPFASDRAGKNNKRSFQRDESLNVSIRQDSLIKLVVPKTIKLYHNKNEKNKLINTYFSNMNLEGFEVNSLCKIDQEKKHNYIKSILNKLGNRETFLEKKLKENESIRKVVPDKFKLKIFSIKLSFYEMNGQNEIDQLNSKYELFIPFFFLAFLGEIDIKSFINFLCFSLRFDDENNKISINDKLFLDLARKHQRSNEETIESSYKFFWIIKDKVYQIIIKMPWMEFTFVKKDIIVKRKIEKEIMIGLILNDFNKWEYYMIDYLYSFKKFRNIFNLTLSKYQNLTDKVFYLDNPALIQTQDNFSNYQVWVTLTNNKNILLTLK